MVNGKIAAMSGFGGSTDRVEIALWRGTHEVANFTMFERGHEQEASLLRVQKVSVKFAPRELIRGKLGGTVLINGPNLISSDGSRRILER